MAGADRETGAPPSQQQRVLRAALGQIISSHEIMANMKPACIATN